ncbi:PKD domain-containing protein [Arthrobacter sp. AQ5-05]|uniref:PKD domain-containing protein n=1 Tax=Arthrobacter sp. AQ5-05 TaxID=2184581 RepID=UPI001E528EDF|nr:hypothetical protein [Arthrobacter sp. AQ5-05]
MRKLPKKFLFMVFLGGLIVPPATVANAANGPKPKWDDDTIGTEVWERIPETNLYGQTPSSGPNDPYVYKLEIACQGTDGTLLPECTQNLPSCNQAADGVAMYWYRSLAGGSPPSWTFFSGPVCIYSEKPRDILAEIAAQISHEFQQTPIAPATLGSQPGPHTLLGQETNLHAHATEQTFNLTMLGQHITITPAAYTFNYGDGTTRGPTTSPGAPLPENRIGEQTQTSHAYTTTGHHTITLTTHFNGHYTVNNGPTLPIPDQGHITSAPLNLTVWRAITRNYAENCITNPQGTGC